MLHAIAASAPADVASAGLGSTMLLVLPLGLLIGLSLGALGGGGSILTVPVLVYLLGQDARAATTSSLLIVGATSLIALVPHARQGRVRVKEGLIFGVLGTAGSVVGSTLASRVSPNLLLLAFAALMLVVATLMARKALRQSTGTVSDDPTVEPMLTLRPFSCACPRVARLLVTATGVGLLTGFFGVGGGFVLVPALVLALDFPMLAAVGTSLLVIAVNSATALATRITSSTVELDWPLIVTFTAAAVVGSLIGSRIMSRTHPRHLNLAFSGLLVAVALYTAIRSVGALA